MDAPIFWIPDEILAYIMECLTLRERLIAERTCRWFRNVSLDYWSSVDKINVLWSVKGFEDHHLEILLSRGSWSLYSLNLMSPHLTDRSLHAIAQHCGNLKKLFLSEGSFTDDGLYVVAKRLRHLQMFHIFSSPGQIRDEGLWWMFHGCKKLWSVCVDAKINGKCLEALGPDIVRLYLERCTEMEDAAIQKMLHSCGKVVSLSLAGCSRLTDISLAAIGQCSRITELEIRDLPLVTEFGLINLCHLKHLKRLTACSLPSMDDFVLVEISRECRQLRELDLRGPSCKVTDIGICSVAVHCPRLTELLALDVEKITDLSLKSMAIHSQHIESVLLESCPGITDEGVVDLIIHCPKLSYLYLEACENVGNGSVAAAIKRAKSNPSKLSLVLTGTSVDPSKFPEDLENLTIVYKTTEDRD